MCVCGWVGVHTEFVSATQTQLLTWVRRRLTTLEAMKDRDAHLMRPRAFPEIDLRCACRATRARAATFLFE